VKSIKLTSKPFSMRTVAIYAKLTGYCIDVNSARIVGETGGFIKITSIIL